MNDRFKFRWPLLKDRTNQFIKFVYGDCFVGKPFDPPTKHFGEPQQCTGLKDKNGNLIYENDYVKIKDNIYKVFWNKTKISLDNILKKDIMDVDITQNMEVVGNVHETRNFKKV